MSFGDEGRGGAWTERPWRAIGANRGGQEEWGGEKRTERPHPCLCHSRVQQHLCVSYLASCNGGDGEPELMSLEQRRAGVMGKGALVAIQGMLLGQETTLIKHPPYSLPRPSPHYQLCYSNPKTPSIPVSNKPAVHAPGFLGPPSGAKASEHDPFFTGPFFFHGL